MDNQRYTLLPAYAAALRRYLAQPREALRQEAYELGRAALGLELGVLDMVRIHQEALAWRKLPSPAAKVPARELKAAETFLVESLSPFEAAHRGFCKAHLALRRLNGALQRRNAELVAMNRALEMEVKERQRVERALQESGDHYRQLFHQASVMHEQACLMQERLRGLSSQILHAQEEERKRISRELHDEIGAALTAIGTRLAMLPANANMHPDLLKEKIAETQRLLGQTMEAVHRFARELRPAMLDELGLLPALRSYLKGFAERTGIRVRLNGSVGENELDDEQKTVLFRVIQESLTNVAKHAAAKRVTVTVRRLRGAIRLRVEDDGRGFEADRPRAGTGEKRLGLLGMAERLRLVHGHMTVRSTPGEGTTICAELPRRPGRSPRPTEAVLPFPQKLGKLPLEGTTTTVPAVAA